MSKRIVKKPPISFLFTILFILATITSCRNQHEPIEFKEGFKAYIYAYTSGVISRSAPIRIRFNESLVEEAAIGSEVKTGVLTFEPAIAGKAIWEDDKTIKFVANENLPSDKPYFGRVDLTELYGMSPKICRHFYSILKRKCNFLRFQSRAYAL